MYEDVILSTDCTRMEWRVDNSSHIHEKNVFWIPQAARWDYLRSNIRLSLGSPLSLGGEFKGAGKLLDDTMELIEKEGKEYVVDYGDDDA